MTSLLVIEDALKDTSYSWLLSATLPLLLYIVAKNGPGSGQIKRKK